ncbi:MAG: PLDc N-terminal domain-containing protein [Gemmatimonadales bacterium]
MPGSILSLVDPWRFNTVLFGVYDYLLPMMLYCAWSTVAFLDLAERAEREPGAAAKWSAAVLLLPVAGAAAYLLAGRPALSRVARLGSVLGGLAVVAGAYALTFYRIR